MLEYIYNYYPNLILDIQSIAISIVIGGLVGLEREKQHKPAGLRTNILICLGATAFTLIARHAAIEDNSDPSRIVAQIVTGVGFLGAGAIMRQGNSVQGLTTAAVIWVTASMGICCGYGYFLLAFMVCLTTLVILRTSRLTSSHRKPPSSTVE